MFSEKDIIDQCRQCKGRCDEIKNCPVRMSYSGDRKQGLLPLINVQWEFSFSGHHLSVRGGPTYTTEELISGLNSLRRRIL